MKKRFLVMLGFASFVGLVIGFFIGVVAGSFMTITVLADSVVDIVESSNVIIDVNETEIVNNAFLLAKLYNETDGVVFLT